jgi:hypothetical protein
MRTIGKRAIIAATSAAIAVTSLTFSPATAAPVSKQQSVSSDATDFSARKRRHHYRNRAADRAVLGAVAGIFGTVATLAARDRYYRHYGYGGGPYYGRSYGYHYGPPAYGYYSPGPHYYYR